jgi:hypothetical protein
MLNKAGSPEGMCVRIDLDTDGNTRMLLAQVLPGDSKYRQQGKTVLAVSSQAAEKLEGRALDVQKADGTVQLVLRRTEMAND